MFATLRPSPTLTGGDVRLSLRMMVWESVASGVLFSLGSGGFMAAFALALGANNLQIGLLAALPFVSQAMQVPGILLVERFRTRKAIGLLTLGVSNLFWIPIGAVPFLLQTPSAPAVTMVIVLLAVRGLFSPVWVTAWSSWIRDLVPAQILGSYHGRRLAVMTAAMAVVGLGASFFVQWWENASAPEDAVFAYSFLLFAGALTFGVIGPLQVLRAREPLMPATPQTGGSPFATLPEPLRDRNFSQLLRFLFAWRLTSNLAIPFFAVYMLDVIGLPLPAVIGFTVLSLGTNVLFIRVWGPMADRLGSKTVLSLSASLYLLVILGWVFTLNPDRHVLTVPLLTVLHVFAGVAAAGVTLTISTLALKEAPEEKATAFLGMAGVATYIGAGLGPILGGVLADFFASRSLRLDFTWTSPGRAVELPALSVTGFEFLFLIAFVAGLLSLNLLVALREEGEMPRERALSELTAGFEGPLRAVSSVPGIGAVSAISYGYVKRVPGADVAIGVAAYQLAASTQAAVASASRGRSLIRDVASAVGDIVEEAIDSGQDVAVHGRELARHATRGAVQAGEDLAGEVGRVARGAVRGTLQTLARWPVSADEALAGAGYGAVQGAIEAGEDPSEAAAQAVRAARETAHEFGMAPAEAARLLADGALDAAAAAGEDALANVRQSLSGEPGRSN
ncbi:MAG: MFS transporter [Chloroflexota bacterium]|nr:MFS transporter [Chloroflexota bacterium]MDE2884794.1 MFS transporter [Chloroflexota bacterium]